MRSENSGLLRRVLVPLLCAAFFALAMALALMSSGVYRNAVHESDDNYEHRTALSYLANQIRRGDRADAVRVGSFGGCNAIEISDDDGYVTYIYCFDGQLCELYTEPDSGLLPSDGTELLPLKSLEITVLNGTILLNADGNVLSVSPRCGVSEVPKF